jgi:hypothetical protein
MQIDLLNFHWAVNHLPFQSQRRVFLVFLWNIEIFLVLFILYILIVVLIV